MIITLPEILYLQLEGKMNKMTPSRRRAEAKTLLVMAFLPLCRIVSLARNLIVVILPFKNLTRNH